MAVDRFVITRKVHLEGKTALIMAKQVKSIRIVESPKVKRCQKMINTVNSTTIENEKVYKCTDEQ